MLTQTYKNIELDLATRTFLYYSDYMISYLNIGSDRYMQWFIDAMQLEVLTAALANITIDGDSLYLGDTEISINFFKLIINKVREYYKADIDSIYPKGSIIDPTDPTGGIPGPITPPTYIPYISQWKRAIYTVTSDGTTSITLPFTWGNIDAKSFSIRVNDSAAMTTSSGAYTVTDGVLSWNYYYDLNAGDVIEYSYWQIKGL